MLSKNYMENSFKIIEIESYEDFEEFNPYLMGTRAKSNKKLYYEETKVYIVFRYNVN